MTTGPVIDRDACSMCGRCIDACPKDVLTVIDDAITVIDGDCILCSHCYAVCPSGALSFDPSELRDLKFSSFRQGENTLGTPTPADLVHFMRSRRSVRKYREIPVPADVLADLVEFAASAPSGSNCQDWEFAVINGREKVYALAQQIKKFFEKLNSIVRNPVTRYLSVLFAGRKLLKYYRNNFDSVESGLNEAAKGRDLLFHGAPAIIIIHSGMTGSLPREDGQYAAYNITLLAHALGLGTCFIGYASETINSSPAIRKYLGIPEEHRALAVLIVGFPDIGFARPALRKNYRAKFL
ncbi:MAG: nitroreductase family protein [Spirochaetes bacterium]|nr:nitroreductase family protein [Spirochaetota bacterium]